MKCKMACLLLIWMLSAATVSADEIASPEADQSTGIEVAEVQVTSQIEGEQLTLSLNFEATTKLAHRRMLLIQGDAVLDKLNQANIDYKLDYDQKQKAYHVAWAKTGRHQIDATFVAKPKADPNSPWQEVSLEVPSGRVRRIQLVSERPDLEVELPSAMRVERQIEKGQLKINAILGPRQRLVVRWKPLVTLPDAKLVLSSQANTIVNVRAGLLYLDALFDFQVAQGRIEVLTFEIPAGLSVTALDGTHIRTWALTDAGAVRNLVVELSRPQDKDYRLRIRAEAGVGKLPTEVEVPAIKPTGGIRASGHLAVGTDSALQLVVMDSSGLTQIDASVFPRVQAGRRPDRPIPQGKAFFYTYAGNDYQLRLSVDDIVPSYDVAGRFVVTIKEDDLVVDAELELDVRDAPIRQLEIVVPVGMVVASVDGNQVEDYHISEPQKQGEPTTARTVFAKPVIGRTLVSLRLELGSGPLGQRQTIPALRVVGAKTERGYVVVATEAGIEVDDPEVENLREVHTASVPLRVAQAQFAYRFRQSNWSLSLMAQSKPAGIRAQVFHLQSIGEALAYGTAVINYIITGSPVDELRFSLPESLENVEFVGIDVRRWIQQDGLWVVKLTRKVIGDYNLAVTYTQQYGPGRPIQLGALNCQDVQTQTGYVVVTSHLDLKLQIKPLQGTDGEGLLGITMDELPGDYRLLTSSPILAAYKYVRDPHVAMLSIDPYQRSDLLPVILDIAAHRTRLAIRPDGRIESVTTVRYKVKNTTGQFLSLAMPAGARVWAVSLVERRGRGEQTTRLAASHDTGTGRLLVPLSRKANPNDPTTIELEYGQGHEAGGWWRRRLDLTAPSYAVPINYADWQVAVPDEWAITATGGNMQAQPRQVSRAGLASVFNRVGRLWASSLERWVEQPVVWAAGITVLALTVLCAIFSRQRLPELVIAVLLVSLTWAGVGAAMCGRVDRPAPATLLSFSQAVNADPEQALQVSAKLTPAWRQHITAVDIVVAASLVTAAALAITVVRRRLWWPASAATLAAVLYLIARIPVTWPALKALMTWGGPAAVSAWCAGRLLIGRPRQVPVPAGAGTALVMLIVGALSVSGGCASARLGIRPLAEHSMIEDLRCSLSAGPDSMEVQYKLRISAKAPASFALLDESAVLVSPLKPCPNATVRTANGRHAIVVEKANVYEVEATFLVPLPAADEEQQRRFELPMPMALTNRVNLVIPDANVLIDAPEAVHLARSEQETQTTVEAMFAPGEPAVFTWRPREREAAQEEVRFYVQDVALAHLTSGLLQVFHSVRLQIAQGQVETLKLGIASGQTVTSVNAPHVGSWRFDPSAHLLEVRLTQPVTGLYELTLVAQSASTSVPYDVRLEPLVVHDALNQHSVMGLAADPSVYVVVGQHPASMNARDYVRDSAELIKAVPGLAAEQITQAFRFDSPESVVTGRVSAVQSELRSQETARFNAEDDRLVYNSQWVIEIAKAGRFDVVLHIPEGFDIDTLAAQEVSHWDESVEAGQRQVRVHFKRKLTGSIQLNLALSRPVAQMPERLTVPRVMLVGVLKHRGYLVIGSEQGVRLSVASRQGLSEVNPAELGQPGQGLLAFRLLRPDWQLDLQTELVQPRVTVQYLHVAKVTEGLVRHHHYLRYRLFHAGTKDFELTLPSAAAGVTVTGAGIARREQLGQGNWRVELADKVYDRPYLLRVTYETQYNQADGTVKLAAVRCRDVDLQQGHTVVFATDRVELSADSVDAALRPAEARNIPKYFGAGDLSSAAMCYRSASPEHVLTVRAKRHTAAKQVGADVRRTDIATVVTQSGQAINRVTLILRVGSLRHLQTILPEQAAIWSLSVDGQAAQPSIRTTASGDDVLLVPLPQQASDDVVVDMVYVAGLPSVRSGSADDWSGVHRLSGPRFDLPLKQITWHVYVPEGFTYDDFSGTLTIDKKAVIDQKVHRYNLQYYERQILETSHAHDRFAQQQQILARELAQKGRQADARRALAKGYNFSRGNRALNEDIRVDLDNLLRQQAKVGLVNARGRLRQQSPGTMGDQGSGLIVVDGESVSFSQQQAERIESSLAKADSDNLELITRRIIQAQEAAEGSVAQLQITMPFCGKMLRFDSPLQVEPKAVMAVAFRAKPQRMRQLDPSIWYGLSVFAGLIIVGGLVSFVRHRWDRLHEMLTPTPRPTQPAEPAGSGDLDEPNGAVSAEELI